eukprot:6213311-Pleurochrysis_carterae.AAC.11
MHDFRMLTCAPDAASLCRCSFTQIQPLDADFPFSCVPGNYGSSSELEQSSPFCAGPCRGGTFCPTEATTSPQECPAGSFCPPGSSVPRLCPSATFGNTTGLSSLHQCTPCPLGHACAAGATAPTPCRPGSYADTPKSSCELVPPGNYQDEAGRAGYKPCKPGFACPEGARVPTACEAGTFSGLHNLSSTADCEAAPRGFFAAAGAAAPSLCPAGRFGATAGLKDGQCEGACAAGHFCPAGSTNGTAHACPAGTYNSFNGGQSANSCTPCPAGLFSATAGSSACGECDAGSVAPETGLSKCAQCGAGQYQPLRGMTECRVCATGTSSSIGNAACSICDSGFYKNFSFDSGDACTDCSFVNGIACPRNSTLDNLRIRQGYWRHSEQTRVVYDCRNGENGWTPCAGGRDAGVEGDGYCAPGYEGPVCEIPMRHRLTLGLSLERRLPANPILHLPRKAAAASHQIKANYLTCCYSASRTARRRDAQRRTNEGPDCGLRHIKSCRCVRRCAQRPTRTSRSRPHAVWTAAMPSYVLRPAWLVARQACSLARSYLNFPCMRRFK